MELVALPAFADNYIWMLHDGQQALVVDPGDSAPVLEALRERGLSLSAILVTHHHADHVGGLAELSALCQGPIWGPADEPMPVPVQPVRGGDSLAWGGRQITVMAVAGHTLGHLAYFVPASADEPARLFCGDTLFSAGCGRLFEGSPAQMLDALQRLSELPSETEVCCAHEYTLSNLRFAQAADPDNAVLQTHRARCEALRAAGRPTLPSTLALERQINPFLRCAEPALAAAARRQGADSDAPLTVFTALREWKNHYR